MTLEEQQQFILDRFDLAFANMLLDFPSINPRVASVILIDIAVAFAQKQGATIEQIITRTRMAYPTPKEPSK